MSGTSLDGLDLALCNFGNDGKTYEIVKAVTIEYSVDWKTKLRSVHQYTAEAYAELNFLYGKFIGTEISKFLKNAHLTADAVASHGHTVFHQPQLGFSTQIGSGAAIAAYSGLTTVCDFRSLDVALGGQGAPLVPIGDKLLFHEYAACLNIGGIANISYDNESGERKAYDICVANMVFNYLAEKMNMPYDKDGLIAQSGNMIQALLNELNELDYYKQKGARSLGFEWFEKYFLQLLNKYKDHSTADLMFTFNEHASIAIANVLNENHLKNILITGGGAYNKKLIANIKNKTTAHLIIPDATVINFKEALIFAFLGYLRLTEQTNTLSSVTGAKQNSIGGAVYLFNQ
jgi:anhydro-N-acetylmuramic acid kinase